MSADLSVVVPTFNEVNNVAELVNLLDRALVGVSWEVIFVDDDSPDGTGEAVRAIARRDLRVRCVERIGRRGLSSAAVEGMLSSSAPFLAVMDGDLQHDETLLPRMLEKLRTGNDDLVVASRYLEGGGLGDWEAKRARISRMATLLVRLTMRAELSDPMSGFFMLRRETLDLCVRQLSQVGFKILADLLSSAPRPLRVAELPYTFRARKHGESKLDALVALEYFELLLDKTLGRFLPVRFLMFGLVGSFGVLVHLAFLGLSFRLLGVGFAVAQLIATVVAMTNNFVLNNVFTYRDRRLHGLGMLRGLVLFYATCALGAAANVAIASVVFEHTQNWPLAGATGALVGAVWNFALSSAFTWGRSQKSRRRQRARPAEVAVGEPSPESPSP